MSPLKIVLVAAPIGSGHKKAAVAVGEALKILDSTCIVEYIDIFDFLPPKLVKIALDLYFKSLLYVPSLYANAYKWGNNSRLAICCNNLLSRILAKKLKDFFKNEVPNAIICTHASAASAVNYLIVEEKINVYHIGIITDFVIHRLWINQTISEYFVYDETLLNNNIEHFIPKNKLYGFGIPISQSFKNKCKKSQIIDNCEAKTILIMGGGAGLLPMPLLLKELNKVKITLNLIVLTGHNEKLRQVLMAKKKLIRHKISIMGFVDNVAELMQKADLLISKPGGVSVSEALCAGLPMLIYRPLPGQEQANMEFLLKKQLAIEVNNIEDFPEEIDKIFRIDNNVLSNLKINLKKVAKPNAAENIAKHILNKLYK